MKTLEILVSMPILATFAAGANIVAGAETSTAFSAGSAEAMSGLTPVLALGAIVSLLLASGLYVMAREMRMEAIDQRERHQR